MTKTDMTIARKYYKKLRESGVKVKHLFVFGSRAKGTQKKWSDLDTCVISEEFGKDRTAERVKLMCLGRDISLLIEPHPLSILEFNDTENPFAREVRQTGIQIV